nr:hypothetical protein [uncultured Carboxylicivirga sp.]
MKSYLPYYFKRVGISLVIIAIVLSFSASVNDIIAGWQDGRMTYQNNTNIRSVINIISQESEIILTWISLIVSFSGFLCYMFSKEKEEDEFIQKLRYISLAKSLFITWIIAAILFIINGDIKLEGFYILQFQLIVYVIVYNYYKKWKFAFDTNS